jgi:hypothetical protein
MKIEYLSIFIFVLTPYLSCAQDLIIKSDSAKIMCKIIKEDSLSISYKDNTSKSNSIQVIKKSDVLKYYNSSSLITDKYNKTNKIASAKLKTNYADTILLKGDTIFQDKNGEYIFKQTPLKINEVAELMSHNSSAYKEMKKARSVHQGVLFTSIVGAIGTSLLFKLPNDMDTKFIAGLSALAVTCIITIPLSISYKKHSRKAIRLFNEIYR